MSYFQGTDHRKESEAPDWGFAAFVIIITVIPLAAVLLLIYLQNPK